ncbi:hypothetical protein [Helicobacter pylori]|uniref:hypothetical protein n=1 Tax=Helicobacter pylori TaxID=210 RepID=UPI0013E3D01C|nr:hypothetical protein [Helicobacter pylori]
MKSFFLSFGENFRIFALFARLFGWYWKEFLDFVLMNANDKSLTEIFCCAFFKASGFVKPKAPQKRDFRKGDFKSR